MHIFVCGKVIIDRWVGKTAVVTGAASGIGAGIALGLANAGVNVVALDIRNVVDDLKAKVQGAGTIISRRCNVADVGEVAATFTWVEERCGGVHILVNCAGILYPGHITAVGNSTLSYEQISATIDVNLKGTILCVRHAVACMKKHDVDGHIININSLAGHHIPRGNNMNVYSATKYAITAFTASLNVELADFKNKIKTTSISPGLVETELASYVKELQLPSLLPKDLADAALYVLSTPPHVNINELTITSVTEKLL